MADGVQQLTDGSNELKDGLIKFDEEAVQKLSDAANSGLDGLVDRLKAIKDAANSYNNFSGITDETTGAVKLIFRSDEI